MGNSADNMITLLQTVSSTLYSDLKGNFGFFLMLFEKGYAAFLSRYETGRLRHYRECLVPDACIDEGKYEIKDSELRFLLSFLHPLQLPSPH